MKSSRSLKENVPPSNSKIPRQIGKRSKEGGKDVSKRSREDDTLRKEVSSLRKETSTRCKEVSTSSRGANTARKEALASSRGANTVRNEVLTSSRGANTARKEALASSRGATTRNNEANTRRKEVGEKSKAVDTRSKDVSKKLLWKDDRNKGIDVTTTKTEDIPFEKDESALQSILDETGVSEDPQPANQVIAARHTLAGVPCKTPRKSFFESYPREARKQQFQKFCDEFIRRMSTMPPEAKRPCIEKSTNLFGTPKTPHNLFTPRSSNFTPRSSLAPSRVKVEKSLFGLGGNQSPACHTPVRTPVRKEILPYSAQRVPKTETKVTPLRPIISAFTSEKKKKQLTWADALEDCRSPSLDGTLKIQKPIHFGQANERDSAIASRNLFCSASSPCNDITSKAIDDESHTVNTNEESRAQREIEIKQNEMQRDQTQETRITPFRPPQNASQLSADIRTLSFGTENIVQIQDNAQSRPNSGNVGGLSHTLSTTDSVNDSQTSQTMTQLSKYPVQGHESHSEYSQQQQQNSGNARTSATSLDRVQQIPSHESQMFTKYFTQGKSVQDFSGFTYAVSKSQTESITVDNAEALKSMYDNSLNNETASLPDTLDKGQASLERTVVDSNGNIKVVSELTERVLRTNQNELFHQSASDLIPTAPFTQGITQARFYSEDKKDNVHLEIEPWEGKSVNNNVANCDSNIGINIEKDTPATCENVMMSNVVAPNQFVCDYTPNLKSLRVVSNANQTSTSFCEFPWNNSGQAGRHGVPGVTMETDNSGWTLFAPTPLNQSVVSLEDQADNSNRFDPPIMTPLAAKDIARRQYTCNNYTKMRHDQENLRPSQSTFSESNTKLKLSDDTPFILKHKTPFSKGAVTSGLQSPDSDIVDQFGAVDLSKSAKKKKQTNKHTPSDNPPVSRLAPEVNSAQSPCLRSAFHQVLRLRLTEDVGPLSLRANMEESRSLRSDVHIANDYTVADSRYLEAMLDDEVLRFLRLGLLDARSPVQRCDNPVAKTLLDGDDMHFIPICEELDNEDDGGLFQDSAFTKYNRTA